MCEMVKKVIKVKGSKSANVTVVIAFFDHNKTFSKAHA